MTVYTTDSSPAATTERYIIDSVTSKDGTKISYRQIGHGAGLVLVHGAMETSQSHMELAEALADKFTVYMPDRRGRGLSGTFGKDYSIQKEVEDLDALLSKTGAHNICGVSSGGLISLQAALKLSAIHKAAFFEPALVVNGSLSTDFLERYDSEIAQGKIAAALVTGMKGAQMGPPIFNYIPRWVLERLTATMMDKRANADDVTMRMLAPTLHYDFQLVNEMKDSQERFKAIKADVLLLGGSVSPAYLKTALDALAKVFPHAKRVEFAGLGHGASGPRAMGGKPELVAQALRQFFKGS